MGLVVKRDDAITAVINVCKKMRFNYRPLGGGAVDYESIHEFIRPPFRFENEFILLLQHNKLGHQNLYFYSNATGDLIGIKVTQATKEFIDLCENVGHRFYGFKYNRIEKVPHELDCYYIIF